MHLGVAAAIAFALTLATSAQATERPPPPEVFIANVAQRAHRAGAFDGVVVVQRGGRTVYAGAFGQADRAAKQPNTVGQRFRLASLTKQVTALLVMRQVAAGRIELDQPVGRYLDGLSPDAAKPTVRQLLQHVSGLINPSDGPEDVVPPFYTRTAAQIGDHRAEARGFCSGPVKRPPGGPFDYNNCDYIVLGAMLEQVSGKPFPQLLDEEVTKPLGLSWSLAPTDPARAPAVARGYEADKPELFQNIGAYGASGGLLGTVRDVAVWDRALLTHRLLSPELTTVMFTADPKLYGEALGSWEYRFAVSPTRKLRVIERQGGTGGTRLLNLLVPEEDAAVVIIANTDRADLFNTYSDEGLGAAMLKAAFGAPTPPDSRKAVARPGAGAATAR